MREQGKYVTSFQIIINLEVSFELVKRIQRIREIHFTDYLFQPC